MRHFDIFGLGLGLPNHMNVVNETIYERTCADRPLPRNLIAVYNDGGGNLYAVKVDGGPEDRMRDGVVAWWHDDGSEPEVINVSFASWVHEMAKS